MTTNKNHNSPNVPNSTDYGNAFRNVPALRFPEFSGEWKREILNDVCTFHNGRAYKQNELLSDGKYHVLRVGNFFTNDSWYYSDLELDDEKVAVNGDLLYAWSASFGPRFWTGEKVIYHYHIWKIDSFQQVSKEFLFYFLERDTEKIKNEVQGGTMVHITKGDMEKREILYPSILEQSKIARLLSLLDERIATQNKIIERYESLIRGINDSLYAQYGNEVKTSFANLGSSYSGLSGKSAQDFGSGKPFITYLNVYSNNVINEKDFQFVAIRDNEKQNVVEYGDVLFTLSSETPEEVGIGSVYLGKEKVYLNSFCFGIHITNTEVVYSPYLSYYVSSTPFRKFIYPYAQGSTRFNLCKADFEKASIKLPSLENQKRIYSILSHIESKTETEKSLLDLYNSQKQYLLRQMLI